MCRIIVYDPTYNQSDKTMLCNPIKQYLGKEREQFQRTDLLRYIENNNVNYIQLRYAALDGHLKSLKCPITSLERAEEILANGERVDGSSLFKSILDASKSDLYVIPIYETAFINPFFPDTMDICCRYLDQKGNFESFTPSSILSKAHTNLVNSFGIELYAMAELEFYLLENTKNVKSSLYEAKAQQGYHEAEPFAKHLHILHEITSAIAKCTENIKYTHSEVGFIPKIHSSNSEIDGCSGEQYEIEFLPTKVEIAAFNVLIAKWIIRNIAYKYGLLATFAPKLQEDMAGTGMHIHIELRKDGKNVMQENSALSGYSRCLIGGLCKYAQTLTAFGNTLASSYLRLVPHQEAPTKIFWSENNRAALIREPLGWSCVTDMSKKVNPQQQDSYVTEKSRQTIELRNPDGSANLFLLLSGIVIAAYDGLKNESGLEMAKTHYISNDIPMTPEDYEKLPSLPHSCEESADFLENDRTIYESVIPKVVLDYIIKNLRAQKDRNLYQTLKGLAPLEKTLKERDIMHKDIYIG